jgi:hypothetical protein
LIVGATALLEWPRNELSILWQTWVSAAAAAALVRVTMARRPDRDELAIPGLVVPAVGVALLGPLSVHAVICVATSAEWAAAKNFHAWVAMSALLTAIWTRCGRSAPCWPRSSGAWSIQEIRSIRRRVVRRRGYCPQQWRCFAPDLHGHG